MRTSRTTASSTSTAPKNHERRSVPIPPVSRREAEALRRRAGGEEQLLFTAPQGGPLRARNFRQRFFAPAVAKPAGGHLKVTPHKLRHTAASLAIASGADVNVVQTMLGHKSATLTLDTYGHLFPPDRLDEVSKKMHKRRAKQLAKRRPSLRRRSGGTRGGRGGGHPGGGLGVMCVLDPCRAAAADGGELRPESAVRTGDLRRHLTRGSILLTRTCRSWRRTPRTPPAGLPSPQCPRPPMR